MPQLLVRNIEASVLKKLRHRAMIQGISVEEAHRRLLRSSLTGTADSPADFLAYLRAIPSGKAIEFPRSADLPRTVSL